MTIEYVLLLTAMTMLVLKIFISAPTEAFRNAGPKMGARVERQLETGAGFKPNGSPNQWQADQ
jgi:hypothetical protein